MKKLTLGDFAVNTYIITKNKKALIIDPGYSAETIKKELEDAHITGILLTHGHFDHMDEIGKFDCPIYLYKDEVEALSDLKVSGYYFFNRKSSFDFQKLKIIPLSDNEIINFEKEEIKVLYTPGHTKGSVCYLYNDKLFTGDTIFKREVGRTDLPTGDERQLRQSIQKILEKLPDYTKIYPGHGENTNVKSERANNEYYRRIKK